ncbi:MAG TPA: tetratricopeptide repeat protein [bacterium]|nr:tetratricopeptide repeat protein [bacterium]
MRNFKLEIKMIIVISAMLAVSFSLMSAAEESKGDAASESKQFRRAISEYQAAIKKNGETEALLAKLARAYDAAAWYGQSVQVWEKILDKYPDGKCHDEAAKRAAAARRWIGVNFYNLGEDASKTVRQLELAVKLDPDLKDGYFWLGRVLLEQGDTEGAVKAFEKLKALDPKDKTSIWLLKEARGMKDNGAEAYILYRDGFFLYEKGKLDEAAAKYSEAVNKNPSFANAWLWLARIRFEQGRFADAIPFWRKVLELQPDNKRAEWFLKLSKKSAQNSK